MREGLWTVEFGDPKTTANYHRDKLDGVLTFGASPRIRQSATTAIFHSGKLISFNGQPVQDHLLDILKAGAVEERMATELEKSTEVDFVETPLIDVVEYLNDKHNLPFVTDTKRIPNPNLPITACFSGIDLGPTLTLLTAPRSLACDYRYGCLWITSAEDAKDWRDPTGVSNIMPPKDSALARAWNEPVPLLQAVADRGPAYPPRAGVIEQSARNILMVLEQRLNITIDAPAVTPDALARKFVALGGNTEGLPFRHMLGQLLYFTGCRCKLEGDKLVILPAEE
jgi:hypothetical protein